MKPLMHVQLGSTLAAYALMLMLGAPAIATGGPLCESIFNPVVISVVGLSSAYSQTDKTLAESYILHAVEKYGEVPMYAKLSLVQRQSKLAVSTEFIERANVIVKTSTDRKVIFGGVMVTKASPQQELPFQKSDAFLGYRRQPDEGHVAEVGRLTVSDDGRSANPGRGKDMVLLALEYVAQNPSITHVYVHTSAVHARLYRMMGFRPESIIKHDDLNYLIRYTRAEVERHLPH